MGNSPQSLLRLQVEDDEIYASLNQLAGMVSFMENPENYDSVLTAVHMDSQLSACMALERKLSVFDQEMALDPRYIHRVSMLSRTCSVGNSCTAVVSAVGEFWSGGGAALP